MPSLFPDEFPFKRPSGSRSFEPALPPEPSPVAESTAPAPVQMPIVIDEPLPEPPPAAAPVALDHERRRSPRQSILARALVRNEIGNGPGIKVELLNISMLGVRFRSTTSWMPGDKASVKLEVGPLRWTTKLRVVHCWQLDDGNYAIGCEFIANELARPLRRAA